MEHRYCYFVAGLGIGYRLPTATTGEVKATSYTGICGCELSLLFADAIKVLTGSREFAAVS